MKWKNKTVILLYLDFHGAKQLKSHNSSQQDNDRNKDKENDDHFESQ